MATNHTTNYGLNLWEPQDSFLRTEFNENTQKIDAALATKGNCRIVTGSYVGTGEYGQAHPNSITFPGKPLLLLVNSYGHFWAINGQQSAISHYSTNSHVELYFKWTGNTVEWRNDYEARSQLNVQNYTYYYVALIAQ